MPLKNPVKRRQYSKSWYRKNRERELVKARERYRKNPEPKLLSGRRWRAKQTRERLNKYARDWCRKNPLKVRMIHARKNHGISFEKYQRDFKKQGGRCAICRGLSPRYAGSPLDVDHNHKTKKVRGFLCRNCNLGIANFKEKTRLMKNAIRYLLYWNIKERKRPSGKHLVSPKEPNYE